MDDFAPAAARHQLARYAPPAHHRHDTPPPSVDVLSGLMTILENSPAMRPALDALGLPHRDDVSVDDIRTALLLIPDERLLLNAAERLLIEAWKDHKESWGAIGRVYGISRQAMKKRYEHTLGGTRSWTAPASPSTERAAALIKLRLAVEGAKNSSIGEWRTNALTEVIATLLVAKALTEDEIAGAFDISDEIMDHATQRAAKGLTMPDEAPRDLDTVDPDILSAAMSAFFDHVEQTMHDRPHRPCWSWNQLNADDRNQWIEKAQKQADSSAP